MKLRWGIVLMAALAVLVAAAGCAKRAETPSEDLPAAVETPVESPTTSVEPTAPDQGEPAEMGQQVPVGLGVITVREAEFDEGDIKGQGRLLKIEVDIRNDSEGSLTVRRSQWAVESDSGERYLPIEAGKPEESGERDIGPNETEDVKVYFDVPASFSSGVLVFEPAPGEAGRVRVP